MSGRLRELKNKGNVQLGNPKSGRGRLWEIFITKFKSKFQRGFTNVVVTWAAFVDFGHSGDLKGQDTYPTRQKQ